MPGDPHDPLCQDGGMADPRAGQPAAPGDLVDVAKLVTAYYTEHPDPVDVPSSGCRSAPPGTAVRRSRATFNEDHILATTPGDLRVPGAARASTGRCSSAPTRTRCPSRRPVSALEVFAANGVRVLDRRARRVHADAGGVARDPGAQRGPDRAHRADGVVVTPVAQPAVGRRLQVQPAGRRPGRHRHHQVDPGPRQRAARRRADRRAPGAVRAGARGRRDRQLRLPRRVRRRAAAASSTSTRSASAGVRIGADPLGGASVDYWGEIGDALRPRPHRGQPDGRPDVPVHDPRLGRQDPDGLLVAVRDGRR